jgi:hypothetical protein
MRHLRDLLAREGEESSFLNRERAFLLLAAGAVLAAVKFHVPLCPFAAFLGVPCPGCGLGRATLSILRGDLTAALALHPLVLVATPGAIALALHATSRRHASQSRERLVAVCSAALLVLMLAVWVSRFAGAFGGPVSIG